MLVKYSTKNSATCIRQACWILKQFKITLTKEQELHLKNLPTEEAVERYKKGLILKGGEL